MGHLLKNAFRWKMRNFICLFWPLVFPLLLGTFFHIALGSIGDAEAMQTIPAALVVEKETPETPYFREFLRSLSQGENAILQVETYSPQEARKALEDKKISGIFLADDKFSLTVGNADMQSDIHPSILKALLQMYTSNAHILKTTIETHPENLPQVMEAMKTQSPYVSQVSLGGTNLDITTQFFYALIAMASLYGGYIGLPAAMSLQANIRPLGARRCITPTHKMKLILSELVSSFCLHTVNILILMVVLRYIYQVPLGGNMGFTLLIALFGVLIGVCFGFFIGAAFKASENVKIGIVTAFSMLSSACAGLMAPNIKITIQRSLPLLNTLNPASVITDALYFIHIYNSPARMWSCLTILGIMSLVLVLASFFVTRGERYASI